MAPGTPGVVGQSGGAFTPVTISGLRAWWEARYLTGLNDGDALSTLTDLSGRASHGTQTTTKRPLYKTGITPGGREGIRFDGVDDFLSVANDPITRAMTQWTVTCVANINDILQNNTLFDVTEQTSTQSILARLIFLTATMKLQNSVRDEALHNNIAQFSDDLAAWRIVTITRNGDRVRLRINGTQVAEDSTNAIGAMDAGSFYTTIGAVRNSAATTGTSFFQGDFCGATIYDTELSAADLARIEGYWAQAA